MGTYIYVEGQEADTAVHEACYATMSCFFVLQRLFIH